MQTLIKNKRANIILNIMRRFGLHLNHFQSSRSREKKLLVTLNHKTGKEKREHKN